MYQRLQSWPAVIYISFQDCQLCFEHVTMSKMPLGWLSHLLPLLPVSGSSSSSSGTPAYHRQQSCHYKLHELVRGADATANPKPSTSTVDIIDSSIDIVTVCRSTWCCLVTCTTTSAHVKCSRTPACHVQQMGHPKHQSGL